jgi:hypothetical protein
MGLFDSFIDACPKCKHPIEIQTKMFDPFQRQFRPGSEIETGASENIISMELQADSSDACDNCGYVPVIVVKNHIFMGYE